MKKIIKWITIISIFKLEIGSNIDREYLPDSLNHFILTHPSQFRPYIEVTIHNVDYIIAFNEKTLEIKYIYTDDKDFKTVQGLKVGSEISLTKDDIIIYPGWDVCSKNSYDGWYPIVGYNFSNNDSTTFISKETFKDLSSKSFKILGFSKGGN
jgi:hypothetical protein